MLRTLWISPKSQDLPHLNVWSAKEDDRNSQKFGCQASRWYKVVLYHLVDISFGSRM